jgi:nicotinamide-nucleotide amidase
MPAQISATILATGSELTRGETHDRNGPFLGTELSLRGVRVDEIALIPDDPALLATAIRRSISRTSIVLLSGGLGPTADDHTVQVLSDVFGKPIYRHPEAERRMRERALKRMRDGREIPANYYTQAEVIEGAEVFLNPAGLAPGMAIPTERGCLAVFPGVPRELKAMFGECFLPYLLSAFNLQPPRIFRAKLFGHGESWAEAKIQELGIDFTKVEYGISAKPGELLVKFIAHESTHYYYIDEVAKLLDESFGDELLRLPEGLESENAETAIEHSRFVHDALLDAGVTVATAESCTGGLIGKRLSDHPGSSRYFLGSVVAYDNRIKQEVLGVPRELLETHGAVSEPVAAAMASGVRQLLGADFALSVTGIAGPDGGTEEKPVGLVYLGLASRGGDVRVEKHSFWGNRENVRGTATIRALEMLRRELNHGAGSA